MVVNSWVLILQCTINKQFAICIATNHLVMKDSPCARSYGAYKRKISLIIT